MTVTGSPPVPDSLDRYPSPADDRSLPALGPLGLGNGVSDAQDGAPQRQRPVIPDSLEKCEDAPRALQQCDSEGQVPATAIADRQRPRPAWRKWLWIAWVLFVIGTTTVLVVRATLMVLAPAALWELTATWPGMLALLVVGALFVGPVIGMVGREFWLYLRLRPAHRLRAEALRCTRGERSGPMVQEHLVEDYLAYLTHLADPETRRRIACIQRESAASGGPAALTERLEQFLLSRDSEVKKLITKEAVAVAVGTALSPYRLVDALIVLWRSARLVTRIADVYGMRSGRYGTLRLMLRVGEAIVAGELAQDGIDVVADVFPRLKSFAPVGQGVTNAAFTIRVGLAAQRECRPLQSSPDNVLRLRDLLWESVAQLGCKESGAGPVQA